TASMTSSSSSGAFGVRGGDSGPFASPGANCVGCGDFLESGGASDDFLESWVFFCAPPESGASCGLPLSGLGESGCCFAMGTATPLRGQASCSVDTKGQDCPSAGRPHSFLIIFRVSRAVCNGFFVKCASWRDFAGRAGCTGGKSDTINRAGTAYRQSAGFVG